jgi:hypothetical protein
MDAVQFEENYGSRIGFTFKGKVAGNPMQRLFVREGASIGVPVNSILAGPTESEGVGGFVEAMAGQQNKTKEEVEKEFFDHARPSPLLKRFERVD